MTSNVSWLCVVLLYSSGYNNVMSFVIHGHKVYQTGITDLRGIAWSKLSDDEREILLAYVLARWTAGVQASQIGREIGRYGARIDRMLDQLRMRGYDVDGAWRERSRLTVHAADIERVRVSINEGLREMALRNELLPRAVHVTDD